MCHTTFSIFLQGAKKCIRGIAWESKLVLQVATCFLQWQKTFPTKVLIFDASKVLFFMLYNYILSNRKYLSSISFLKRHFYKTFTFWTSVHYQGIFWIIRNVYWNLIVCEYFYQINWLTDPCWDNTLFLLLHNYYPKRSSFTK